MSIVKNLNLIDWETFFKGEILMQKYEIIVIGVDG